MAGRPFFAFVPPAGHPIGLSHLFRAFLDSTSRDGAQFRDALREYLGVKHCFLVSSGTAALYLILKAVSEGSDRDEVIIPAYCCPSLVAAAAKVGLKVRLCDVCTSSLGLDLKYLQHLLNRRTLCVVAVHLFGIRDDIDSISELAAQQGVAVIEDSAQALWTPNDYGESVRKGDIGLHSFGRGKPLTLLGGGAIVTDRSDFGSRVEKCLTELSEATILGRAISVLQPALYSLFIHPSLYWFPNSIRSLRLGETYLVDDFGVRSISRYHASLGKLLISMNDPFNRDRLEKSRFLIERLTRGRADSVFSIPSLGTPVPYLRLPVVFASPELREAVLNRLISERIGATRMYGLPLSEIPGVAQHLSGEAEYPNARYIAPRLLTLPTNPLMTQRDLETIGEVFDEVV
jgi:dTDP-4-amino-4,6-dideoxygalactose transaminase